MAKPQWDVSADKIIRYEDPPTLIAEGNVLLEKREAPAEPGPEGQSTPPGKPLLTVKSDWMAYDITQNTIRAKGNLWIDLGSEQLAAESGTLNLQDATGTFEQATVLRQSKAMHLEGRTIKKTGELTYQIEDGWVVTCKLEEGETPPWSFAAADTKITDGGYAFLKHATFRIKDIPVFYSPIMLLPAKRERQTGFLMPLISSSTRDGFGLETPFFIDLSPSADLTLYPRYMSERGFMYGAEARYVLGEESKGMLAANYLDDDLSHPSETDYYRDGQFTHTNSERYWLRAKADQNIGSWVTRLDLDMVSDGDYLREFNSGSTGFDTSNGHFLDTFGRGFVDETYQYRDNTLSMLRSLNNGSAVQIDFLAVNDVSNRHYSADFPSQAWKLPSLTYTGLMPVADIGGGTNFSWNANYTNFWRDKGISAQRIDLMPALHQSLLLNPYLETTIGGSIRSTSYLLGADHGVSAWRDKDTVNRFLYNLNGEVGTTLMRDFGVDWGDIHTMNHMLRPFVAYEYTSIPDKKILPDFDGIDELEEENTIYYGVHNFFSFQGTRRGKDFDRDAAFVKIRQGYDLRQEKHDKPLTPVKIESGFYPLPGMRLMYKTHIGIYGEGAYYHAVDADYRNDRGDFFSLDYRYNEQTKINSVSGSVWYNLPFNLAAGYRLERAIEQNETIEEEFRFMYKQPCWSAELAYSNTPGDETFLLVFHLANIGNPLGIHVPGM